MFKFLGIIVLTLVLSACQNSKEQTAGVSSVVDDMSNLASSLKSGETLSTAEIVGPRVAFVGDEVKYSLSSTVSPQSAQWSFSDEATSHEGLQDISRTFQMAGTYRIKVDILEATGAQTVAYQTINILDIYDGLLCSHQSSLSVPEQASAGDSVNMSLSLPNCLKNSVSHIQWNFADGSESQDLTSVSHQYNIPGTYEVQVLIYVSSVSSDPFITLTDFIKIDPAELKNPNSCEILGQTRILTGDSSNETETCGNNGQRTNILRQKITQECRLQDARQIWVEISRTQVIEQTGTCFNQSCLLPDGSMIAHGSKVQNIQTGEIKVKKNCAYNEDGIFDIYNQVSEASCNNGVLSTSNDRQAGIKSAGQCPTYNWQATEQYTSCSADCGGQQSRVFKCVNNAGENSDTVRCQEQIPTETRICDGNPKAVERTESSTSQEEANSSAVCPKNQIGVIAKVRELTTTRTYACVDHQVQVTKTETIAGPWTEESYCRDFVARRCSQDSLSNKSAHGRIAWMRKCSDAIPEIAEFLQKFDDVERNNLSIDGEKRILYPTFMDHASSPEKPWIAPVKESADCTIPEQSYIAAVCVSSCATPEQQILIEAKDQLEKRKNLVYTPFIEALTSNVQKVATLKGSSMNSQQVRASKVDQWVTEMMDTEHHILKFTMASGGVLKLTLNHPVLTEEGEMKSAELFKVGDNMVMLGGQLDPIVSIEPVIHFGKVYNVFVKSADPKHNIVVTNGYLNGSAFFQNEGAQYLNKKVLRGRLIKGVFNK